MHESYDHQQSWLSSEALMFMDLIYMTKAEEVYKTLCKCWPHFTYRYNTWYWMVSWMGICLNWNHQDNRELLNVICLGVQIKGGHHIGHLLESNLSRHTALLHINEPFQKGSIHCNCLLYMTVIWIRNGEVCMTLIYVTQVKYTINYHIIVLIQKLSQYGVEPQ